jgi:2OG-Fe(II) oxygenase superfamily
VVQVNFMIIVDRFAAEADTLRAHFDTRFAKPREAESGRFVWDFWHVPGQYSHLRTPAYLYFPKRVYDAFHQRLVKWGRETLGCHDVSPPWLSCYVDGCSQELHGDLPHGHFAWVFSLTKWQQRSFSGGETMMLREDVLDYWRHFQSEAGIERDQVLQLVPPEFNRLLVFDPRIPHGVREVRGTRDPREGRLVIHGWFVQPRPFISGPLSEAALDKGISQLSVHIQAAIAQGLDLAGLVSLRFIVSADGRVQKTQLLVDTTRGAGEDRERREIFVKNVLSALKTLKFPKQRGASTVTLPLVFERA